jgi:acyl-CoA thioesterase FadM
MTMQHRVLSTANRELSAEGDCVVVTYDYVTKRPIPIPADLRDAIARVEQRSISDLSAPPT